MNISEEYMGLVYAGIVIVVLALFNAIMVVVVRSRSRRK